MRTPTRSRRPFSCSPRRADEHAPADWFLPVIAGRPVARRSDRIAQPSLASNIRLASSTQPARLPPICAHTRSHASTHHLDRSRSRRRGSNCPTAVGAHRGLTFKRVHRERRRRPDTDFPTQALSCSVEPNRAHAGPTGPFVIEPPQKIQRRASITKTSTSGEVG